jgi:hypothetical protein
LFLEENRHHHDGIQGSNNYNRSVVTSLATVVATVSKIINNSMKEGFKCDYVGIRRCPL